MKSTKLTMEDKNLYEARIKAEFDKLNAQIDEMKAKARQAEADSRIQYQKQLELLKTKQTAVQEKLQELHGSAQNAWDEMQIGVEAAWQDLQIAFKRAMNDLK